ncbi:MAG: FkbM family methyltransferase [Bacteroidota bacterium]
MLSKLKKILGVGQSKGTISKKKIARHLPDNPIIIEAGASTGEDTYEMAQLFPRGTIYAFEPLPNIYDIMSKRVANCPNVKTFQSALSDQTGTATINVSSGNRNSSSSLMTPKEHLNSHPDITFDQSIEVPTISLDDFIAEQQLPQIDFLWLDMQGYEYAVLSASEKIFDSLQLLYTEVSLVETYEGVPLYKEYRQWLESKGMEVLIEELPWPDMGNVLFRKKQ